MKFDLDGQTYDFDENHISFAEFRWLKRELDLSSGDYFVGMLRLDVEALAGAVLLHMKRLALRPGAAAFTTADLDQINMVALIESVATYRAAAAEEATQDGTPADEEPDPAAAAGPTAAEEPAVPE